MSLFSRLTTPLRWVASRLSKKPASEQTTSPNRSGAFGAKRIALLGHTAAGKTVFYACLYHRLRNDPPLQLTASSAATEAYLLEQINLLLGREEMVDEFGRRKTVSVDPQWPPATLQGGEMDFSVRMPDGRNAAIEMREYAGEIIGLQSLDMLQEDVREFFHSADCVFFMIDPEMLDREIEMEARVGSLVVLLNGLARNRGRAKVPLAIIVSKADTLPGFHHPEQVALLPEAMTLSRRTTFEQLRRAVMESEVLRREPVWAESVGKLLDRTSRLLRVAMRMSDRFQIFFVTSTGKPEERIDAFGQRRSYPPRMLNSIGLEEVFAWWARISTQRSRELGALRFLKISALLALLVVGGAAIWYLPHKVALDRALAQLPKGRCEVGKSYAANVFTWLHPTIRKELLKRSGFDPETGGCEVSCNDWAAEALDRAGCRVDELLRCDDVGALCFAPFETSAGIPGPAGATEPPRPGVAPPLTGGDRLQECRRELKALRLERILRSKAHKGDAGIRNLMAGLDQDLGGAFTPESTDLATKIRGQASLIISCAGGREMLDQVLPGDAPLVGAIEQALAPGKPGDPSPVESCVPAELVRAAHRLEVALPESSGETQTTERQLLQWLRDRALYCLRVAGNCANLASASKEQVLACKKEIGDFKAAGPPGASLAAANDLDLNANLRLTKLDAEARQAAPGGAGEPPGAGSGGHEEPAGRPPSPLPPAPEPPAVLPPQRHPVVRSVLVRNMGINGVTPAGVFVDVFANGRWSQAQSWWGKKPFSVDWVCVPEGARLRFRFAARAADGPDERRPVEISWDDLLAGLEAKTKTVPSAVGGPLSVALEGKPDGCR